MNRDREFEKEALITVKRSLRQRAQQYISQRKKRKELASVVAALAVVVALGTTWMLSLPGITMERDALCGMAEHQHSEACYERTLLCTEEEREPSTVETRMNACSFTPHEHTSACYNKQGVLACGKSERYFHKHTSACYDAAKQLICPLKENVKHIHADACYTEERTLTCEQAESAGHQHTDACSTMVRGAELTCGLEESAGHQHTDACYTDALTCTVAESAGHQHTEACYTAEQALTCAIAEGEGAHHHSEGCYEEHSILTCALTEHTHGDACRDAEGNLVCALAEHAHDASCHTTERALICEQPESDGHVHADGCYEARQALTCTVAEGEGAHAHDASCYTRQLTCAVAEGEGAHTHTETCYPLLPQLTCTIAEGEGAHTHTDECYATERKLVCDHPELHEHTADCRDADGFVTCGLEELPTHKHSDDCFTTATLTDPGHQHTEVCYEATLICTLPEHAHSEACYAAEEPTEVPSNETTETEAPVTDAPETEAPEAEAPVTDAPETEAPVTDAPETEAPVTDAPETEAPETEAPVTGAPETEAPETEAPVTGAPETEAPETEAPVTNAPETEAPATDAPETEAPETEAPVTDAPETEAPVTDAPETEVPETDAPATDEPTETVMTAMLFGMPVTLTENEPIVLAAEGLAGATDTLGKEDVTVNSPVSGKTNITYDPVEDVYSCDFDLQFKIPKADVDKYDYFVIPFGRGIIVPSDVALDGLVQTGNIAIGDREIPALKYKYEKNPETGRWQIKMELDKAVLDQFSGEFTAENITGFVRFAGSIAGDQTKDDGSVEFNVIDGVTVNVPDSHISGNNSSSHFGSIGAKKSSAGFDPETNTLTYKVLVYSHKGTMADVKLSDVMTLPDGFTMQNVTVTNAQKISYKGYNQSGINSDQDLYDRNESTASGVTITPDTANNSFEINVPKLEKNEAYYITYQVKVDGKASQVAMQANNKLTASSDTVGNTKIETTTEANQQIVVSALSKSGKAENGHIVWTLTVNNSKMNIAGGVLNDPMLQNALAGTIKIDPAGGVNTVTDASGTHFEFVPTGDGKNNSSYTITYETDMPELDWFDQSITNDAKLTVGDDEYHGQAVVGPMHDGAIEKKCTSTAKDENTVVANFTTTVKLPEAGLKVAYEVNGTQKKSEIVDKMGAYRNQNDGSAHAMTAAQANALKTSGISVTYTDGTTGKLTPGTDYDIFFHKADGTGSGECDVTAPAAPDTYDGYKIVFKHDLEKSPYGGATLTMNYSSTADTTSNKEGTQYYYKNDATLLDRTGYAEFTDYKRPASVQKVDGKGNTGTSNVTIKPDDTLTWKVIVRGEGDEANPTTKVHMVDTLPEGLELVSLKWGFEGVPNPMGFDTKIEGGQIKSTNPSWEGQDYGNIAGSIATDADTGKQTLTVDLSKGNPGNGWKMDGETESLYIEYKCKLTDALKNAIQDGSAEAVQSFANSVKVSMNDGILSDPVTQTQETTIAQAEDKEISKNVVWYTENDKIDHQLHYSLVLNPAGKDHQTGNGMMELVDELTYQPEIYEKRVSMHPGSVKLYYIATDDAGRPMKDENGNFIKGARVPASEWKMNLSAKPDDNAPEPSKYYFVIDGIRYDYPCDWTTYRSKLTLSIPDKTPLILEYDYDVSITIPEAFKPLKTNPTLLDQPNSNPNYWTAEQLVSPALGVSNTAKLTGVAEDQKQTSSQSKWTEVSNQAGLITYGYELVKVDADDMSFKLGGAEFTLYSLENDVKSDPLATFVTDENGSMKVTPKETQDSTSGTYYFERDVLYFFEETKAPEGYMLPDADTRFYFYHRSADGPVISKPIGASGLPPADLSQQSRTCYCYNKKTPDDTPTYLSVSKVWKDASGGDIADTSTLPDVQFMVYQTVSETQPVIDEGVRLTVKKDGSSILDDTVPKGTKVKFVCNVSDVQGWWCNGGADVQADNNAVILTKEEVQRQNPYDPSKLEMVPQKYVSNEIEINSDFSVNFSANGLTYDVVAMITQPAPAPVPDGATALGPYTLSAAGGWTWDNATAGVNLPKEGYREGKKVYFTYYVREVGSLAGWTGSVMPDVTLGGATAAAPAGVALTNARNGEETTELSITKNWQDDKGADLDASTLPESITVQVWRKADPTDELVRTVELKKAQGWNAAVGYLPKAGQYYVTEVDPPEGFTVGYSADADHPVNGGNVTVTNTKTPTTVSLTVNKVWKDENGIDDLPEAERLANVQVQLMRRPVRADGMMTEWEAVPGYDVVTLAAPWTHTWNDLPRQTTDETTGATTEWRYTALELPDTAPGFTAIQDENEDAVDSVTLTNIKQPTTSIKVQKVWRQADGTTPQTEGLPESITVQLWYKVDGVPDQSPNNEGAPVTLTASDPEPWAHTWENLPKQEMGIDGAMHDCLYYIEEIDAPFGFTVAYTNNDGVNTGEITVTNTLQETSVKIEKKWANADGSEITEGAPETVRVKLMYQRRNPLTNEKIGAPEQYLNALDADGYYTVTTGTPLTIDHLPAALVVEGKRCAVRYFVEELPESDFVPTYSDNNVDGVTDATEVLTITNTRAKGSLNVTKKYQDVAGSALNRAEPTTIRFKLKQFTKDEATGIFTELDPLPDIYEITVNAGTAEGAHAIDGLPIKDADGNDVWYQAVEVDDTGAEIYAELDPAEPQKLSGTQAPVQLAIINLETSVSVEKKWQLEGVDMTIGLPDSVTLTLRRYKAPVDRDPSAPLASFEDTAFHGELTLTPDADARWKASQTGLPAKVMEGGKVYEYLYYFTEDNVPTGWQHNGAADTNNAGIASGEATIVNEMITYTLPNTGGPGTLPYTLGGLTLLLLACALLYNQFLRKRRDEQS